MIIGVIGLIGSGKGTLGDMLVNLAFVQESFAKPLKDAASIIFGWPRHLLEGDTKESRLFRESVDQFWSKKLDKPKFTPRLALQWLGTESGRKVFGDSLWTASLQKRLDPKQDYVITDVRFQNEIAALREVGGYLVRVHRGPDPDWMKYAFLARQYGKDKLTDIDPFAPDIHVSEWDWLGCKFDSEFDNNGTLEDMKDYADKLIQYLA